MFLSRFGRFHRIGTYSRSLRHYHASLTLNLCIGVLSQYGSSPLLRNTLTIELQGEPTTRNLVLQHLERMAEVFSRNWTYDWHRSKDEDFCKIVSTIPVSAAQARELDYGAEPFHVHFAGKLQARSNGIHRGFFSWLQFPQVDLRLWESRDFEGEYERVRHYPCMHVPIPAAVLLR